MRQVMLVLVILTVGCFATWDTVKTQPPYASSPGYVHFPAPVQTPVISSRGP